MCTPPLQGCVDLLILIGLSFVVKNIKDKAFWDRLKCLGTSLKKNKSNISLPSAPSD